MTMNKTTRRQWMMKLSSGSLFLTCGNIVFRKPVFGDPSEKTDIGVCKKLTITSISEVGWWDSKKLISDFSRVGDKKLTQWEMSFDSDNSAGCCSLIDMEDMEGKHHKFLLDTGWNLGYMDRRFKETGVDRMLENGEIEFLYISHEHFDHLWGLEMTLKYKPDIKIIVPGTLQREAYHLIRGAEFMVPGVRNRIHHKGEIVQLEHDGIHKLFEGCASVTVDLPISPGIRGEQSLYFNVKDKGIVCVTGCCHQTILSLAEFARSTILGGKNLFGVYGGLHISPMGILTSDSEKMIQNMKQFGFKKIAVNHCTGLPAVKKMIELGYPVVRGNGRFGSMSNLYIGNGDSVTFG
jgi:7,8-dihydropterin-6-yl-methyl-4-(beta-D-ribofuranosyl)aminobenzene 5'-phosphate synthase